MTALHDWAERACGEILGALAQVDEDALRALVAEIRGARQIALHGVGREGLMMRALAMRLHHLGLNATPVGDMTAPALHGGDLLLVSAGPGRFATVEALMGVARDAGSRVTLLTAQADAPLRRLADLTLVLPVRTMASGADRPAVLPMGSAYEGAQFVLFEHLVALLREALAVDEAAMRQRHTNLE